jgi:hypothetical protein
VVPQTTHVAIPCFKVLRLVLERFGCPAPVVMSVGLVGNDPLTGSNLP